VQADKFIKSTIAALEQQHGNRKTLQEMLRERKAMDDLIAAKPAQRNAKLCAAPRTQLLQRSVWLVKH
jgi:hypothetical protein